MRSTLSFKMFFSRTFDLSVGADSYCLQFVVHLLGGLLCFDETGTVSRKVSIAVVMQINADGLPSNICA